MYVIIFSLVCAAALLFYGALLILTWRRGLDRAVSRWFAFYLAAMMVWSLGALMMYVNRRNATVWNKVMLSGTTLMPLAFYGFVQGFLTTRRRSRWAPIGIVLAAIVLTLNAEGHLAGDISVTEGGLIEFSYGPATPLFGLYYCLFIGLSAYDLMREFRTTRDFAARNRAKYVTLGLTMIVLGSITNVVRILSQYPLDIASNVVNAILLAYAISRYHLLDLSIVIRKGLLYFLPTSIIATGYLLIILLGVNLLHLGGFSEIVFSVIMALLVAAVMQPVRERAQQWVDRLFFREKLDSGEMLQRLSRTAASVLDLRVLAGMILDEITTTMHISAASLLLKDKTSKDYLTIADRGLDPDLCLRLRADNPIADWLAQHTVCMPSHVISVEPQFAGLWAEERLVITRAQIEIFVPLLVARDLVGVLMLGPRRSETPYSREDQLILLAAANQLAVAVQNAWLYRIAVEEKEQTNTVLQRAFAGILVVDPDMRILTTNRSTETITGYTGQELQGKRLPDIFDPELWGAASALRHSMETGQPTPPVEATLRGKHESRDILLGVTPVRDGYLLNFTDITRLKEVDRLKSNIVSNVSHELRTPLASIKAYTELLLDEVEGEDKALRLRFLSVIDTEADRLAQFINDLLDLSRLQSGRINGQAEPTSLGVLIDEVAKSLDIQAQRAGVAVRLDFPSGLPMIRANKDLMRSMARNLIGNAIKYSPKGGEVRIGAHVAGDKIVVEVIDQGIGIPPEDLPHLFTRFYRSWIAQQAGIRGTGLGLVVAKEAAEQHGGTIAVESQVGVGTRFTVTLPISADGSTPEPPAAPVDLEGAKIWARN